MWENRISVVALKLCNHTYPLPVITILQLPQDLLHHHFMSTLEYEIEDQWISDDNIRRRILKAYDDEQKTRKFAQYESAESSVVRRVSSGRNRAFRKRTR